MMLPLRGCLILVAMTLTCAPLFGQVIEYENNGHKYQTLSRKGLTVIVTHLPTKVQNFGLIQVSVANGSQIYWSVKPEDFSYVRQEVGYSALSAKAVVDLLLDRGSGSDVIHLVTTYENALYGIPNMRSTNGYEARRRGSLSAGMPVRLKAAAAASALALTLTRLSPGQSTDGAVFIPLTHELKALAGGKIIVNCGGEIFEFNPE